MKTFLRSIAAAALLLWGGYALAKNSGNCESCSACPVEKICVKK